MSTVTARSLATRRLPGCTLIAAAVLLCGAQATLAQEMPVTPESAASSANVDPPGRIARLNYTAGTVTTEPAGAADWSYAQINRPLTTGDQLWNDQDARSELHIGSTAVRLGPSTSLDVLNLDDNTAQLKVAQGTLSTRVRELPPGTSYEIDTPNVALGVDGPGDYRVDVAPDGSSTTVTVRNGSATAYGESGQVPVAAGRQIRFGGTNLQRLADNQVPGLDSLDQWAVSRDAAEDRSVSAQYVSRDVPGYQDLDANGTWRTSPQYGEVWVPRAVPADWAPYHDGHWVWQAPWGWTWVDDQPWGFAPYHYGRWVQLDDTWAWVPGPMAADAPPVYAPALVAFVGDDEGVGVPDWGVNLAVGGIVAAGVVWFPLGPGEPWHPHWRGRDRWSERYYERVNRNQHDRNVNIHNTYVNYRAHGGLTAVPATAFVHGQPVARFAQKVDPRQWHNARFNPGGLGIAPVRESFGPGLRNANYRPPAGVIARPVVATRSPAAPAAYHDNLAQRFAQTGGRVPGGGEPVVRTSVPARVAGGPGALSRPNVRLVQSHIAGRPPGVAAGAPTLGAPNGAQPTGLRPGEVAGAARVPHAGEPQARPGMPSQLVNQQRPQQPGEVAHPTNRVPRPPQAGGGNVEPTAQQRGMGMPQQAARQPGASGSHEPVWAQPHTPMAQQRGAPIAQPGRPGFAQQPGPSGQPNTLLQQHAVPRPAESPAPQPQSREQAFQAQRQAEAQVREPRQEFHPQPMQMARPDVHPQQMQQPPRPESRPQQVQQVPQFRPEPRAAQIPQPRLEPRPQPIQQPRPEPRPQPIQQPRLEPRPQPIQQPRPEPRPQPVQQPRAQPQQQHAEQHSGSGNRDERHKG